MVQNVLAIRLARRLQKTSSYVFLKRMEFYIKKPFSSEVLSIDDCRNARRLLNEYRPNPNSTSIHKNVVEAEPTIDLTIVIPCYNVAAFLEECVSSVLNQITNYTYKVVLVDDGSTDATGEIVDSYADKSCVKIIHQENRGLSGARNQGIYHIDSKYITFVDSDDYLAPGAIQSLLDAAYAQDADIVEGSHYRLYKNKLVKSVIHTDKTSESNNLPLIGMAWGKIYKSSLFSEIIYPEKLCFEDSICSFLLYPSASRIVTISDFVYVYRIVTSSISHSSAKMARSVDTIWITEMMLSEHENLKLDRNAEYSSLIIKQIVLNYIRLKQLPEDIQKAAFVVTSEIFKEYCSSLQFERNERYLVDALSNLDFGRYKLFCQTSQG